MINISVWDLIPRFSFSDLIPAFVVFILVGSVLATIFIKPEDFKKSRTYVFASMAASVAVVIFSFNVLLNTSSLELQKNITTAQFTKQAVDKLRLYPNQILSEKKNARPEFLASLYYNNLELYNLTKCLKTGVTVASELEEQYISILLFQCWEDYLTLRKFDQTGDMVWIINFLQWAQSMYLKENFDRLRHNFSLLTIYFGNLLFEYAKKIPIPSKDPLIYKRVAFELLGDSRLQRIYEERIDIAQ